MAAPRSAPTTARRGPGWCSATCSPAPCATAAAVLDVIAGPLPGDPYTAPPPAAGPTSTRSAPTRAGCASASARTPRAASRWSTRACVEAVEDAAGCSSRSATHVEPASPAGARRARPARGVLGRARRRRRVRPRTGSPTIAGRPVTADDVEPFTWMQYEIGQAITAGQYLDGLARRAPVDPRRRRVVAASFDLLLTANTAEPAPRLGDIVDASFDPFRALERAIPFAAFTGPVQRHRSARGVAATVVDRRRHPRRRAARGRPVPRGRAGACRRPARGPPGPGPTVARPSPPDAGSRSSGGPRCPSPTVGTLSAHRRPDPLLPGRPGLVHGVVRRPHRGAGRGLGRHRRGRPRAPAGPHRARARRSLRSSGRSTASPESRPHPRPAAGCSTSHRSRRSAVDVERNLRAPLVGIGHAAERLERAGAHPLGRDPHRRHAPTTSGAASSAHRPTSSSPPPSRCTSCSRRGPARSLRDVETVIVDEIHAVAGTKRGAHLALSLERLEELTAPTAPAHRSLGHPAPARRDRRDSSVAGQLPGSARSRSSTPGRPSSSTSRSSSPSTTCARWARSPRSRSTTTATSRLPRASGPTCSPRCSSWCARTGARSSS